MFRYIWIFFLFEASTLLQAKTVDSLSFQLESIYKKRLDKSQSEKIPIFPVRSLRLEEEKNFNIQLFQGMQNVVGYFDQQATETISTQDLYSVMESYVEKNALLSTNKKAPFEGCRISLHKIKNKTCINTQALYVIPYSKKKRKNFLINRYFNTYILPADNSYFFSVDVYEKQSEEEKQCVYKQKQWGDSYLLPSESDRQPYIDKERFSLNQPKMLWFCFNSYSPSGANKQTCNLLKVQVNKIQVKDRSVHFLSSFSAKENSCKASLQQEEVVTYSKKHKGIVSANSESSYYSIIVEKNKHLLIYTDSAYCSVKPEVKEIYESNLSRMQFYACIGEDDSSYYSNYRLLGVDPDQRSELSDIEEY